MTPISDKDSPYHMSNSLVEGLILNSTFPEVLAGFWSWSKIRENNFLFLQKKKKKVHRETAEVGGKARGPGSCAIGP